MLLTLSGRSFVILKEDCDHYLILREWKEIPNNAQFRCFVYEKSYGRYLNIFGTINLSVIRIHKFKNSYSIELPILYHIRMRLLILRSILMMSLKIIVIKIWVSI